MRSAAKKSRRISKSIATRLTPKYSGGSKGSQKFWNLRGQDEMKTLEQRIEKLESSYGVKQEDGLLTWPEILKRMEAGEEFQELAKRGDADARFRVERLALIMQRARDRQRGAL